MIELAFPAPVVLPRRFVLAAVALLLALSVGSLGSVRTGITSGSPRDHTVVLQRGEDASVAQRVRPRQPAAGVVRPLLAALPGALGATTVRPPVTTVHDTEGPGDRTVTSPSPPSRAPPR